MITETFLKIMVGGTAIIVFIALVYLIIKLHKSQQDEEGR